MTLKKFCSKCNRLINYSNKYCDDCSLIVQKQKDIFAKERYRKYSNKRRDLREQEFYKSKEWISQRAFILSYYCYIDVYAYYYNAEIIQANTVHHIVELKNDWNKRLDSFNLFACSKESHKKIHLDMKLRGKKVVEEELKKLLERFKKEFNLKELESVKR